MRIETDLKLDFNDVLIRPKRSSLNSRSEVELSRDFTFVNSKQTWSGIPIVSANMDTTGTIEIATELSKHKLFTCLHKHYTDQEITDAMKTIDHSYVAITTGINKYELDRAINLIKKTGCKFICLDVANGYTEKFVESVKYVRQYLHNTTIIAGNVVTAEMVEELIIAGADIIKIGIGPGCLAGDTRILMADGTYRKIENIQEGDYVINMYGKPVKVNAKMDKGERNIVTVSSGKLAGTKITSDHKILTLDVNTVKTNWIEIGNVTNTQLLVTPNNIQWDLPSSFVINIRELDETIADNMKSDFIQSGFNIGYIFGLYLIGVYQKLSGINIRKLFTTILAEKNKSDHYIARCKFILDKIFCRFLDGKLPTEFKCTDKPYITGLLHGMNMLSIYKEDFNIDDDAEYICTTLNNNVLDVFEWCCLSLHKMYRRNTGMIIVMCNSVETADYIHYSLGEIEDIGDKCRVWDIEVDCPTHSFIAEGIVVHNSVCTTRKQTGVGYPQLSAIIECADAAHGLGGCIISDGGCTVPGDIAKAFGAGADFVMLGGMLSGHDESGGATINEIDNDGNEVTKWKEFYGMSSKKAMDKYSGGVADYRSSEGKAVRVPYKGPIKDTVLDILGGLRSACTYIGALKLKELSKRTTFIRTTQQLNNVYGKS